MKRIAVALFITIITCLFATADDVIKVLRVYSGGEYTTIPLSGVDSLVHSRYDSDGILHNEHVSSIVHAIDRDYQMSINNIDSIVVLDFDMWRYENEIAEIKKYMDEQEGQEINTFLKNLLTWLKSKENIQDVAYDENIALITIRFRNGLDSHVCFQNITDNQEESSTTIEYASTNNNTEDNYYNVSFEADEQIMENTKILHIKGMDMLWDPFNKYNEEKECLEKSREQSPVKFEEIRYSSESLDFMKNLSDYGLIVISQTHGSGNGGFFVTRPEALDIRYFPSNFVAYVKSGEVEAKLFKSTPVYLINPSLIAKKLRYSDAIVYANYCWSYGLANNVGNDNTVIGFRMKTSYWKNYSYYTSKIFNYILNGITCNKFVKDAVSYELDISESLWFWEEKWINVYPSLKSPGYQKRYFSISMDELRERSENGNPIIKGRINGYNNLKKNQLDYVAFCHEGPDNFTPNDDDVIKIKIPKDKINSDGTFEFEFQGKEPLKSAIVYGFCFGFEYKGNTYYGETKLYGDFDGLEYEKLEEVCFMASGEHMVLFNYEIKTNFEINEYQKEFKIGLYLKDELLATIPIEVEEGNNEQTTQFEFACTKEDFEYDYANYRAEVKDLCFRAISTYTIDGNQTDIVFSHPDEKVDFTIIYDQKPDVRFTTVQVGDAAFKDGDAYVGYLVEAKSTGTLFMKSVRLITEGEGWSGAHHDVINDLIYDNGYIYDGGVFEISNYKDLGGSESLSPVIGYYEITESGTNIKRTSSNHVKFTSRNGKYITDAVIKEGAGARILLMSDRHNYIATDKDIADNDNVACYAQRGIKAKNKMLERWRKALKIRN